MYTNFDDLIEKRIKKNRQKKRVAVICADDDHTLEAVVEAHRQNLVEPILIGRQDGIQEKLSKIGETDKLEIIHASTDGEAIAIMLRLFQENQCDFIMKGKIDTKVLMRAIINKENGLNEGKMISSVSLIEIPNYHKMVLFTDPGIVMYPDLRQKVDLLKNALLYMKNIGYKKPKASILCSVEKLNLKMQETIDAVLLSRLAEDGVFGESEVYGPLSYDLTVNPEAVKIKGVNNPVAGDADVVLVPDINTGNSLTKALSFSGGNGGAVILGAKIPIIFSSRGSTKEEKFNSIIMAASVNSE